MNLANLEQCEQAFQNVRKNMVEAMLRLAAVFAAKAHEGKYSSWAEFVEDGLKISQSSASKMLRVHEQYVLMRNTEPQQLHEVDLEKLYLSIPLLKEKTKEEVIEQAKLLSRQELKESIHEAQNGPHTHVFDEKRYGKCGICKGFHLV